MAPLVITDLKRRLQAGFVVLQACPHCLQCKRASALSTSLGWSAGALMPLSAVSVTVKPRPLWLQAVRKQREAAYRHAATQSS